MNNLKNRRFYKGISLLIKVIILLLSFWYIWEKISKAGDTIDFKNLLHHSTIFYLSLLGLLMFLNWGLEAWKWKILIRSLEEISFLKSIKAIFSGVTVSIFSPNRTGEFAGRIFFLKMADKIQASLKSVVGSILQLVVTVLAGLTAIIIFYKKDFGRVHPVEIFKTGTIQWLAYAGIIVFVAILIIYKVKNHFSASVQSYFNAVFKIRKSDLFIVSGLSLVRYFVFSFQYYLSLMVFNIDVNFGMAFMLIAITFFVTSAIPTFALTEIAVRGATAVYFFSAVNINSTGVLGASLLLWIINLAIPAIIGAFFFGNLIFFKE